MKMTTTSISFKKVVSEKGEAPYFVQGRKSNKYYTLGDIAKEIYEQLAAIADNDSELDVTVYFEEEIGE